MTSNSISITSHLSLLYYIAATIFAYGQTSSGKTYTMRGIAENVIDDIYAHIKNVNPHFFDSMSAHNHNT